ncbi:hypothetical protein GN956_G2392 [Arapaima gigas]
MAAPLPALQRDVKGFRLRSGAFSSSERAKGCKMIAKTTFRPALHLLKLKIHGGQNFGLTCERSEVFLSVEDIPQPTWKCCLRHEASVKKAFASAAWLQEEADDVLTEQSCCLWT